MRQDDIKLNEAYSQVHTSSETLEEGILDRMGARLGSVGAAAAQRLGNVGAAWRGDTAGMVSHKDVYQNEKQRRIVTSLVKAALNDISKLGLFGDGYVATPDDTKDLTDLFNQFVADKRGSAAPATTKVKYSAKGIPSIIVPPKTVHPYKGVKYAWNGIQGWKGGSGALTPAQQKEVTDDYIFNNPKGFSLK
jgi:hypothetical protein